MHERCVRVFASTLAGIVSRVGPFGHQRRVEPLEFPVRLRTTWRGPFVPDPVPEYSAEVPGPVTSPVIGHHRFHADTDPGQEPVRRLPEACCDVFLLVVKDLGVDQPAVVIHARDAGTDTGAMKTARHGRLCPVRSGPSGPGPNRGHEPATDHRQECGQAF